MECGVSMGELADTVNDPEFGPRAEGTAPVGADKVGMGTAGRQMELSDKLSAQEREYLSRHLKGHVEYYRLLAGNSKCTAASRAMREMLEGLWMKVTR
jgi:hypothetical protein